MIGNEIQKIIDFYNLCNEGIRLNELYGELEYLRTLAIFNKYLPNRNNIILDIGGATGKYSFWFAQHGNKVHLLDAVEKHIKEAKNISRETGIELESFNVGDARQLPFENQFADVVLLMGPLYHLVEETERLQSLKESLRVLKPGGLLLAVGISRFASTIDGLASEYYKDEAFKTIMLQDLTDGRHTNPTDNLYYFMDTFFHHPSELKNEVSKSGFIVKKLLSIEGIGYTLKNFEKEWNNNKDLVLEILDKIEDDESLIGASPHMMCIAQKEM